MFRFLLLVFFIAVACQPQASLSEVEEPKVPIVVHDTLFTQTPIRIGNDRGQVGIQGAFERTDGHLTDSEFELSLMGFPNRDFRRKLSKIDLIDSCGYVCFQAEDVKDFTEGAVLQEITYDFIRANSLYFIATLYQPQLGKSITGKFGIIYQFDREGEIYFWYTDGIRDLPEKAQRIPLPSLGMRK
ncbi:MAG: hypothetical protein AAFR61_14515 [Bacteroidota bacterium]